MATDPSVLAEEWARRRRLMASSDVELAEEAFKAGYMAALMAKETCHDATVRCCLPGTAYGCVLAAGHDGAHRRA